MYGSSINAAMDLVARHRSVSCMPTCWLTTVISRTTCKLTSKLKSLCLWISGFWLWWHEASAQRADAAA